MTAACLALCGCQSDGFEAGLDTAGPISAYRDRMLVEQQQAADERREKRERGRGRWDAQLASGMIKPVPAQAQLPERQSLLREPRVAASQPSPADILAEIPDPADARTVFNERLERIRSSAREERVVNTYRRVIEYAQKYLQRLEHKKQVRLSLAECVQRTLANNYTIRIEAYGPAISRTQLVEAEAAFDAVFFLDAGYDNQDKPTGLEPAATQSDTRSISSGFRKLLPTGMRVQTSMQQSRTLFNPSLPPISPRWDTAFIASFTQPLLKGFGLDYNRAPIEIRRKDLKISEERFVQQVRDRLFDVEQAYWQVLQARRIVFIAAERVAQNQVTYENIKAREEHDATPVEINNSYSRWKTNEVEFSKTVQALHDAEDRLKNLMNDPDFKLSEDIELLPTEMPYAASLAIDHFAEVRTGLDERSEIRQAKLAIEQSRIQTAVAKNETLPQLDLSLNYQVDGLDVSSDASFDNFTTNRFRSYSVVLNFEVPVGQRASRAALVRARAQESQAILQLHQIMDGVVEEINRAVRALLVDYENIPTQLEAVIAADRNLRALQERALQVDPSFLETELSAVEGVASTRATLLQVIVDYNIAVVALEKAKGTLLEYNNVLVPEMGGP